MHIRRLSFLIAVFIVLSLMPAMALPVHAAYENTYVNTGKQRADIVGVALTQVGYREGDGKSNNNKNKYSSYFGYGARAWCGDFVSWCARQAEIPKTVLKTSGPAKPSTFGITKTYSKGYTPLPGDLFFRSTEHVGIVYYTEGKYFYTIEGNTWTGSPRKDGVYIRKRLISDFTFGVPNYTDDSASDKCEHTYETKNDAAHPHKEYEVCTKCSSKTYTGNEIKLSDCSTCIQEACSHNFSAWETTGSTKHKRTCTLCGKSETGNHKWSDSEIIKEATCNKKGTKKQVCTSCSAEKTTSISATGKHTYNEPFYIDEVYHGKTCADCGNTEKAKHTLDKKFTFDDKDHWNACKECNQQIGVAAHEYENGCGTACKTCGYLSPITHVLSDEYTADDLNHYKICTFCNLTIESELHTYTGDCDETCNVCLAERKVNTAHTDVNCYDEIQHWVACSVCTKEQEHFDHVPDTSAKDWEDQACTQCGFLLRSADEHTHTYQTIDYDRRTHWGVCVCGAQIPAEGHRFSMETGKCNICNADSSPISAQYDYDPVWITAICAFALALTILLLIHMIRKSRRKAYV